MKRTIYEQDQLISDYETIKLELEHKLRLLDLSDRLGHIKALYSVNTAIADLSLELRHEYLKQYNKVG